MRGTVVGKWVNMSLWNRVFWKRYAFGQKSRCQILEVTGRGLRRELRVQTFPRELGYL
jgi:hypothetical protein